MIKTPNKPIGRVGGFLGKAFGLSLLLLPLFPFSLLNHDFAEPLLNGAGIEDRHLTVENGESQEMAVSSAAEARQCGDTVRASECAGFGLNLTAHRAAFHHVAERAAGARDGEVGAHHAEDVGMVVSVAQGLNEELGCDAIFGAEAAGVVDGICSSAIELLTHKAVDIVHAALAQIVAVGICGCTGRRL